ncbi:MAG TPA: Bax inhibitor-1/YccA family protein [Candidatus Fournierella merdavium]|nr:Bax inhibitor-1/YccA family protein [Candidatus Fournierella merdavium]
MNEPYGPGFEPENNTFYATQGPDGVFNTHARYETLSEYTAKTFGWMFAGLMVTFLVALAGYTSGIGILLLRSPILFLGLAIAEIAVVVGMSARIHKIGVSTARGMFFLYAALNGAVFSCYFYLYQMFDLVLAFGATALYFGIMAAYGYLTKQDLSGWAKPLFFGLIAMLIVSVVGIFIGGVNILLCCLGIIIFACYTAYDTQKIKAAYFAYAGNPELAKKASVFSALELYLDFINLFLYILRIFSRSRN